MKKIKWYQRVLAPLIFWGNLLKTKVGRLRGRPTKELAVPPELLPLLQVGTLALRYSEYAEVPPESLKLSAKLQDVVDGTADRDTMIFVEKVLFNVDLFSTVYTWMVFLGDAHERDREPFRTYLDLYNKRHKKNA